jgi:3',5'-cyclic AMP phosphodiesterase CpdA
VTLAQIDTLSFLHITDLHVIFNQKGYPPDMMEYRKQKQYDQGENRLRQFFQTVPGKTNSDMVIATGDLVDFFEAETTENRMLDLQAEQFSRLLDDYHIPVFLTLGNHDMFTFNWQNDKLKHHQNSSGRARAAWIRNIPCFKNGTYYSELFQVGQTTYRFIFLDNGFYQFLPEDKTGIPYTDKSQLYWLNSQLHESDDDIEIILMHIPFKAEVDQSETANELYAALSQNPSAKLILAGHKHRNAVNKFSSRNGQTIVQVETGSLVQSPPDLQNWRLIRLTENNILISAPGKIGDEVVIPIK